MTDEWIQVIECDRSHPCIVAWVPFNESTGLINLADRADEQNWVRALTALTAALDPTRPVVSNDGWETLGGDIIAGFCYTQFTDTYQEINGLLTADRQPKFPIEVIAAATRGAGTSFYDPFQIAP
jgi:hypothetical protein